MKKEIPLIKFFVILLDFVLFFLALALTLAFRFGSDFWPKFLDHFYPFFFLFPLYLLTMLAFDLYNFFLLNLRNLFFKILNFTLVAFIFSVIYFYFNQFAFNITPKTNLILFLAIFSLFLSLNRVLLLKNFYKEKINVYFWGDKKLGEKLKNDLQNHSIFNYQVFQDNLKEKSILVIDPNIHLSDRNLIKKIISLRITCFDFVEFYEKFLGRIPLEAIDLDFVLRNIIPTETKGYFYLKRAIDLVLAIIFFLFLFVPLFLPIAFLIFLNSPGPIFFLNERVGYRGKIFKLIKFRTMRGEHKSQTWAVGDEEKRIFFVGKILRKTHLDELPQLINILKGELSFVGPRPEQPEIAKELEGQIPFYSLRTLILPGFTGWAQVNFKYPKDIEETKIKLEYDLYYLKNSDLFLDILTVVKSFQKFLGL